MEDVGLQLTCVGINHSSACVEVRECIGLSSDRLTAALKEIHALPAVQQVVVVSTCNRTEIYAALQEGSAQRLREWLVQQSGLDGSFLHRHLYELRGRDAAVHLCCVASGLNSQVLGESEILGQVKAASQAASSAATIGPELDKLFAAAVRAGKRVRSETAIGRGAFSIGRCAVETAKRILGSLKGRAILILGAGKVAENAARHLQKWGADPLLIANRTYARAEELARELGGRALRYDQVVGALREADIVVSSTSAPHFVLSREQVSEAMTHRDDRELFLIDIAVPRDIDPQVAAIPGVHLYDIDDLGGEVEVAAEGRVGEVEAARRIAHQVADEVWQWLMAREAVPLLRALRNHFHRVQREQLAKFSGRLERLAAEDREWVEQLAESIVNRLLHEPAINLKAEIARGNESVAQAVALVYDLVARDQDERAIARSRSAARQGASCHLGDSRHPEPEPALPGSGAVAWPCTLATRPGLAREEESA